MQFSFVVLKMLGLKDSDSIININSIIVQQIDNKTLRKFLFWLRTRDDPKVLIFTLQVLSRVIFARHNMHHSTELAFNFIMMLIFSRCTVSLNNLN